MTVASVSVPPLADCEAIATAAGNPAVEDRSYHEGRLYVRGVTQQALDAALALIGTAPPPTPRLVTGEAFLSLWTDDEITAAWAVPPLRRAAMGVMARGEANLASPQLAALLDLAIAHDVLTAERKASIIAGEPPQ